MFKKPLESIILKYKLTVASVPYASWPVFFLFLQKMSLIWIFIISWNLQIKQIFFQFLFNHKERGYHLLGEPMLAALNRLDCFYFMAMVAIFP